PEFGEDDVPDFEGEEAASHIRKPPAIGADVTPAVRGLRRMPDPVRQVEPEAQSDGSSGVPDMEMLQASGRPFSSEPRETVDDVSKLLQVVRAPTARLPHFVTKDF